MSAIFISYRRDDTEGQAGRLFQGLREQFGAQAVFMDVSGIEPGRDFRKVIDANVAQCGVLLAVIGRQWLTAVDAQGQRRIDSPQDFVRLETASALQREIPVVPVLVQGAQMPRADQLPPDLADLAYRNAVELTHARWDSDLQVLVNALRRLVGPDSPAQPAAAPRPAEPPARPATPPARGRGLLIGAVAGAAAVLAGGAWLYTGAQDQRQAETKPAAAPPQAESAAARPQAEAAAPRPQAKPAAARPQAAADTSPARPDTADARRMTEVVVGDGQGKRLGTYQRAADGSWGEHDPSGKRVFVFRELSRDAATVDLWDDSRQVGVQLDLRGRAVHYRGNSQEPYRLLYRVLSAR